MKLWYLIKKYLGYIYVNSQCNYCKYSIEHLENRPLSKDDVLLIVPDKYTDIYHIGRTTLKDIQTTKIYKDIYGGD